MTEIPENLRKAFEEGNKVARANQAMSHSCLCGKMPTPEEQAVALKELEGVKFLLKMEREEALRERTEEILLILDCLIIEPGRRMTEKEFKTNLDENLRHMYETGKLIDCVVYKGKERLLDALRKKFLPTSTNPKEE